MAEPLKHFFSPVLARSIAADLAAVDARFASDTFVARAIEGLGQLELLDRGRQFALALGDVLPADFERAAAWIEASLPPVEAPRDGAGMAPFRYLPHTIFAVDRGLEHPERTLDLLYQLTQRFTAEFAIREVMMVHSERTWARLETWVEDPSAHVRRLVSEGTRTRLPWGRQVPELFERPERTLALLERLRDDPSEYVRRSVANNLNDLAKDRPDLVVEVSTRWLEGASAERERLVRHALRTLIKRAHPGALALVGAGAAPEVEVASVTFDPPSPRIGEKVRIRVTLDSTAKAPQRLLADLAVHFVKARGTGRKVFKAGVFELEPKGRIEVAVTISLAQHTTRRHYPGRHEVELVLNGQVVAIGGFELQA